MLNPQKSRRKRNRTALGRRVLLGDRVQHFDPDFLAAAANLRDVHGMSQHG